MGILHTIDTVLTVVEDHKEVGFLCVLLYHYSNIN